jgi:phosphate transport system substrate-binding protein
MRYIKLLAAILTCMTVFTSFAGCATKSGFDMSSEITVISREDGSGTRGAFVELFGIEQKNANGEKVDYTVSTADITQSTGVMITSVSQNAHAIGYISLGSLNDSVKALKIDGAKATVENIKNGSYKISRPFNIATKENLSEVAKDFVDFILSEDGQKIVEQNGYIAASDAAAFSGKKPSGKITIAGSSSVTPVMEKLREAYLAINTNATIEINQSDSTTGVNSVINDICDIGMASRELKDSELSSGITPTVIALDGIAVIVNNKNTVDNLTVEQVRKIYMGDVTKWSDVMA